MKRVSANASFAFDITPSPLDVQNNDELHMARQVLSLVEAGLDSNFSSVRQIGQALMTRTGGLADPALARQFAQILRGETAGAKRAPNIPVSGRNSSPLIDEIPWPSTPLFLEPSAAQVLRRFVEETQAYDQLAAAGLNCRSSLILEGPPGTGKTLAAGHIAARLGVPFYVVRLDALVSSFLGDTARHIRQLFDYFQGRPGLLFLDEFDALAKSRDDGREVGELKRVVNTILQCIDFADPRMAIVAATNHASLLDPAVWRRFPYKLGLELPDADLRATLWEFYLQIPSTSEIPTVLSKISKGLSGSDIADVSLAARRSALLASTTVHIPGVVRALVDLRTLGHGLPDVAPIEGPVKVRLWKQVQEIFGLVPAEIACLWSTTRQNVEKQVKVVRRGRGDTNGTQSDLAPEGRAVSNAGAGRGNNRR